MIELSEGLKSCERVIRAYEEDYQRYSEAGAYHLADIALGQIRAVHKVKSEIFKKENIKEVPLFVFL